MKEKVDLQIDADAEAATATGKRLERQTLRVHNALTRMKLRMVEKRCSVLMNALGCIATTELPIGHRPTEDASENPDAWLVAVQRYAEFVLDQGGAEPDRLAVVGYAKDSEVYCMDCSKHQKGSMEPVCSGVDFIVCAGCAAGLFVE